MIKFSILIRVSKAATALNVSVHPINFEAGITAYMFRLDLRRDFKNNYKNTIKQKKNAMTHVNGSLDHFKSTSCSPLAVLCGDTNTYQGRG